MGFQPGVGAQHGFPPMVWAFNLIRERWLALTVVPPLHKRHVLPGRRRRSWVSLRMPFPQQFTLHRHVVPCVWILPSSRQWVCLLGVTVEAGNLVEAIVGGEA